MPRLINVHTLPKFADPQALAGGTVVVIDVLRATTTIIHALAAGAKQVVPCGEIDEAIALAKKYPRDEILLGGERGGLKIEGFDLGNSPEEYTPERAQGRTIIFTTTNGTRALLHAKDARQIMLGAFVNASALAQKLLGLGVVHLLCAGTENHESGDDVLFAGLLLEKLQRAGGGPHELNPQAIAARDLWLHTLAEGGLSQFFGHHAAGMVGKNGTVPLTSPIMPERLAKILQNTLGGKNLVRVGLQRDILAAAQIDRFAVVPQFDPKTAIID
jgi:2-phosphosulfolactate phosphatase